MLVRAVEHYFVNPFEILLLNKSTLAPVIILFIYFSLSLELSQLAVSPAAQSLPLCSSINDIISSSPTLTAAYHPTP